MKHVNRILAAILATVMLFSLAVPSYAAEQPAAAQEKLHFDPSALTPDLHLADSIQPETEVAVPSYADGDMVRVSIVLEKQSTLQAGFSTLGIAQNAAAMAYRLDLRAQQDRIVHTIESTALQGEPLDVVWNLTLAANIVSANVEYGKIEKIQAIPGVQDVFVETIFEPALADSSLPLDPNMSTSPGMIGSPTAYAAGFTGAGSRIAVIDTGVDTDHQSFSVAGYDYSLGLQAEKAGMSLDAYKASLDLLDTEEIAAVLNQLNVAQRAPEITAGELFVNDKLAFGYNYVDGNLTIHHDSDKQGSHGSHVAGIATANAYIPNETGFVPALDSVLAQGVAPDAQLLTMKVFGAKGGASESDYMAAMEDAIVLGADSVNLSLGGGSPGFTCSPVYEKILASLTESDTVVVTSAGNSYSWPEFSKAGNYLYGDDVNLQTGGTPGSFANSLSIASVDNDGYTGKYLLVDGTMIFYSESTPGEFSNQPISTLAGDQEYIFVDSIGSAEEFAAIAEVLAGKIAVCWRGTISFYEKAEHAVKYGAIATIICNNAPGTLNMDLSSYTQKAPCICVAQADAAILMNAADPVTDDDGNVLYYAGSIHVGDSIGSSSYGKEYNTMSDFSSWGIPGSLILKPELTAPGGNIYSVDGVTPGGAAYENMSGTSMAAPQVSGMAALVSQYLEHSEALNRSGLSRRALIQSLLMSTATPLTEEASGSYWSLLKQGAGLANVGAAVSAQSCLIMGRDATASAADGKVKAELGDDANRTGIYQYSFTIQNLNNQENSYTLSTDLFTQDILQQEGQQYLDLHTRSLSATTVYTVNGTPFLPKAQVEADVDRDGDTDADDAQALLDYLLGNIPEADLDLSVADLDGNGKLTTYDAHLLLANRQTAAFTVPAGGSVEIQVSMTLPDSVKDYLNACYVNGAYVEGYTYVHPVSSPEGQLDVTHSIPVLGFYGNWSEASMFDRVSYTESLYDTELLSYTGVTKTNNLLYRSSADKQLYYHIGNPYTVETSYPEGKAAIRSTDSLAQYQYTLIRNAAAMAAVVTDDAGNVLYTSPVTAENYSAYYYVNGEVWQNTTGSVSINKTPAAMGQAEGSRIHVSLVAIPEYYVAHMDQPAKLAEEVKQLLSSGKLGAGASLTTTLVIDDTAPELLEVSKSLINGNLMVTAKDNQHIAYVAALSRSGAAVYGSAVPTQGEAGESVSCTLEVGNADIGEQCIIFVADYAGNSTSYTVEYGGEAPDFSGKMLGYTRSDRLGSANAWVQIEPSEVWFDNATGTYGGMKVVAGSPVPIAAADYADGYIFFIGTDLTLYVAPISEPDYATKIIDLTAFGLSGVYDMAMNYENGMLYVLDQKNGIWSVNPLTGAAVKEMTVTLSDQTAFLGDLITLTMDDSGRFYSANYGSPGTCFLYTWTLDDAKDQIVFVSAVGAQENGGIGCWSKVPGSMAWDHDQDILYMACAYDNTNQGDVDNKLWIIDPQTGKGTQTNSSGEAFASTLQICINGLLVVPQTIGPDPYVPTDEVLKVDILPEHLSILSGTQMTLDATTLPWNLSNRELRWTSSDEQVVTVEHGVITTHSPGQAIITATSALDSTKSDTCTITVEPIPDITLNAATHQPDGTVTWTEFTAGAPAQWEAISDSTPKFLAGGFYNEKIYTHDGANIYSVDPTDFTITNLGSIASSWLWSDAAAAPKTSNGALGNLLGLCANGTYLELLNPEDGNLSYFNLSGRFDSPMATVAFAGSGVYYGMPSNNYYLLLENGELYVMRLFSENADSCYMDYSSLGNTGLDLSGVSAVTAGQYASMVYDETTGYLAVTSYMGGDTADLYLIDPDTCLTSHTGSFGEKVCPVVSLYQFYRPTDLTITIGTLPKLFEGTSAKVDLEVILYEQDPSVTWTSSDPSVAVVDEHGVVTGMGAGTATITATTVEVNDKGQHVSASCTAVVEAKADIPGGTVFQAQIQTAEGNQWVTVDTTDMRIQVNGTSEVFFTGGGYSDGKLYGSDGNFTGMCNFYQTDPDAGYTTTKGANCSSDYAMLDLTTAPAMEVDVTGEDGTRFQGTAFGAPFYMCNAHAMFLIDDYIAGTVLGNSFLAQVFPNCAALTYAGPSTLNDMPAQAFYVLSTDGKLDLLYMRPEPYTEDGVVELSYSFGYAPRGNVGRTFDSHQTLSMTVADMDQNGIVDGLLVADASAGRGDLFYIDLTTEALTCGYIGSVPGATSISSLYVDQETSTPAAVERITTGQVYQAETLSTEQLQQSLPYLGLTEQSLPLDISITDVQETTQTATGGLHTAVLTHQQTRLQTEPRNNTHNEETREWTVAIIPMESSTNGRMQVTYDPQELTLVHVTAGLSEVFASKSGSGAVDLAYASNDLLPADNAIAALTFQISDKASGDVSLTVFQTELNDQQPDYSQTLSTTLPHVCPHNFTDVTATDWFHEAVDWAYTTGLMLGVSDTRFLPNEALTRAQLATVLYRAAGAPAVTAKSKFRDVPDGTWYTDAVAWAAENGIVLGMDPETFSPHSHATREQIATVLYRYAESAGLDVSARADLGNYTDHGLVHHYASQAMSWAVATGLIQGTAKDTLSPRAPATRAQTAEIMFRFSSAFGD